MFNRGARKELRKKGGIEDVQHFKNAGPVVGQVGSGIPGVELGRTFTAPYYNTTFSKLKYPIASTMGKGAEKGLGALGPIEQGILNSAIISSLGDKVIDGDSFTGTPLESIARGVLGYPIKLGAAIPGIPSGILQSLVTGKPGLKPDDSSVKVDKDGKRIDTDIKLGNLGEVLGSMVPDRELMESYGFQFFPTSGEELERFKRMQKNKQDNEKRDAAVEKQKQNLKSSDAINAALAASAQKEGKSSLGESDKAFIDSLKGTTVDVNPTTGNVKVTEDPSKPDPISQKQIQEVAAEGPGSELDFDLGKDGKEIINEIIEKDQTETETETETEKDDQYTLDRGAKDPIDSTSANQVKKVFQSGSNEEKANTIDDMIKQFKDRAPKYEGLNQGLAIAKIGFAMAAGESPNALTNIAKALNDGADMLIKDKAERDAFNRQVDLSALQYGLTEDAKIRTEDRAEKRLIKKQEMLDLRNFRSVVANKDITYNGITYKKGEDMLISMADIIENNGQLPAAFDDANVYLKREQAAITKQNLIDKIIAEQKKALILDDKVAKSYSTDYGKATDRFIQGEVGAKYLEEAVLMLSEDGQTITGFKGAGSDFVNKVASFAGIKTGDSFKSKAQFQKKVKLGFQNLIKSYFGGSQSANSISNFDVTSLADAYVDAAFQESGVFNLSLVNEEVLLGQLQTTIGQFRKDQKSALAEMKSIEGLVSGRTLPGKDAAAAEATILGAGKEKVAPYLGQGTTQYLVSRGDDGVIRFNI
jgi:hypothetical protein